MALSKNDLELIGLGFLVVLTQLNRIEGDVMGLKDTTAQLVAEDAEIADDVAQVAAALDADNQSIQALNDQIAALTAAGVDQGTLDALQKVADDLAASHTTLLSHIPTTPAPADTGSGDTTGQGNPADGTTDSSTAATDTPELGETPSIG